MVVGFPDPWHPAEAHELTMQVVPRENDKDSGVPFCCVLVSKLLTASLSGLCPVMRAAWRTQQDLHRRRCPRS